MPTLMGPVTWQVIAVSLPLSLCADTVQRGPMRLHMRELHSSEHKFTYIHTYNGTNDSV
jgi:hypothetical protein